MKLLLTGNATCANRGDSAIFRGLIHELQRQHPAVELVCCSRHPVSSREILGVNLKPDWLYEAQLTSGNVVQKAKGIVKNRLLQNRLYRQLNKPAGSATADPPSVAEFRRQVDDVDAVIHVGGSFFVDLYGVRQFDAVMASHWIGKPVYLAGHSMGPFEIPRVKKFAAACVPAVDRVWLREHTSLEMLQSLGVSLDNVVAGADTAWLMPDAQVSSVADAELDGVTDPLLAVTVRRLAPFDKRLGVSQAEYETRLAVLLNQQIESGHHVVGVSMCTGLGGYQNDDRLVACSVRRRLRYPERMTVLMHEYNDLQVGAVLQRSVMLIGTRLHSVILALRYGTPAVALFYEHKSEGVLKQLGLGDWSVRLKDVDSESTGDLVKQIIATEIESAARVGQAVRPEQERAAEMVAEILNCAGHDTIEN